jgi:hypothetical protein
LPRQLVTPVNQEDDELTNTAHKLTDIRFEDDAVRVTIDGEVKRYSRKKNYYVDGALLRSMVFHNQADGRRAFLTFLITAFPRKACRDEMPGHGRAKFTGWEYVMVVTKDSKRCKTDGGRWLDIDKLCFSFDLLD